MSETSSASGSPFSTRVVAILIAVAVFSFGAIMVLAGWAPELRDRNEAGDHPFSTSALGYNGFVQFLEAQGYPVEISRFASNLQTGHRGTLIVTLSPWGMGKTLEDYDPQPTTLIVLPKWRGLTDWLNPTRQKDTELANLDAVSALLERLDIEGEIARIDVPDRVRTPFGPMALKPDLKMQVIR